MLTVEVLMTVVWKEHLKNKRSIIFYLRPSSSICKMNLVKRANQIDARDTYINFTELIYHLEQQEETMLADETQNENNMLNL